VFRLERELRRGYRAWQHGELARAIELLERVHAARPFADTVIFPLARALHESGERAHALELLDATIERAARGAQRRWRGRGQGGIVHRATIRYDCGDDAGLASDIARLGEQQPFGRALAALAAARAGRWEQARFPVFAFWNVELAGRMLALLEARWVGQVPAADDTFHHRLFAANPPESPLPASSPDSAANGSRRGTSRRAWSQALERAFDGREFATVLARTRAADLPADWRDPPVRALEVFASISTEAPETAVEAAADTLAACGPSLDLCFLSGLALARAGSTLEAAFAFVRAARSVDGIVHDVLTSLAAELGIALRHE